jgi:hypothetical protein
MCAECDRYDEEVESLYEELSETCAGTNRGVVLKVAGMLLLNAMSQILEFHPQSRADVLSAIEVMKEDLTTMSGRHAVVN